MTITKSQKQLLTAGALLVGGVLAYRWWQNKQGSSSMMGGNRRGRWINCCKGLHNKPCHVYKRANETRAQACRRGCTPCSTIPKGHPYFLTHVNRSLHRQGLRQH